MVEVLVLRYTVEGPFNVQWFMGCAQMRSTWILLYLKLAAYQAHSWRSVN